MPSILKVSSEAVPLAGFELATRGYTIFRSVLPQTQINDLRSNVIEYFHHSGRVANGGQYELRGMNCAPWLARFMSSDAIISVIRQCVAPERPVLTGECDMTADTLSGWHKDITEDMELDPGIFSDPQFQILKLAVYLQDQPASSPTSLKIRPRSHRLVDSKKLPDLALDIRLGDIVVFDVRIDHAGQVPSLAERVAHRLFLELRRIFPFDAETTFMSLRRTLRRATGRDRQRIAIFMTFGPDRPATRIYEKASRKRHGPIRQPLDHIATAALARQEVEIVQVRY